MLAIILGIFGSFGPGADTIANKDVKADTIILNTVDTTVTRLLTVNRVMIIGNKVTKSKIISRELSLKSGDTVSTHRLNALLVRDKNKIYNLRLFNTVSLRVLEMPGNQIDLLIEVTERWYLFPSPIFELSDRNFNEWWQNYNHDFSRVNYGMRLYLYNFRGRNETVRLTAQFGFTRKFELSYQLPYINQNQKSGLVFNMDYGEPKNIAYYTDDHKLVYYQSKNTVKHTFGASVTYSYRKSFYTTHLLSVGYRSSSISDSINLAHPEETRVDYYKNKGTSQQFMGIGYSFNSDHRDVILYPLKGYQYSGLISYQGIGSHDVNLLEINVTQAYHWDLKKNYYLSNFTTGYISTPTNQPYAQYNALGYRRQFVRGYEVYVIEGPAYALNKTTFKKRILQRVWRIEEMPLEQFRHFPLAIYIKGYADFGYVQNYPAYEKLGINTRLSDKLLAGAGGGVDIVSLYDVVFRFEYTFTREGTQGFFFNVKKEF